MQRELEQSNPRRFCWVLVWRSSAARRQATWWLGNSSAPTTGTVALGNGGSGACADSVTGHYEGTANHRGRRGTPASRSVESPGRQRNLQQRLSWNRSRRVSPAPTPPGDQWDPDATASVTLSTPPPATLGCRHLRQLHVRPGDVASDTDCLTPQGLGLPDYLLGLSGT